MLSRVADAVFWMSRYVERAVAASRLVDVTLHLQLDAGNMHETWELWNPESVIACIHMAREAARGVRDSLSTEMWEQLNTLNLWLADPNVSSQAEEDPAVQFSHKPRFVITDTFSIGLNWQILKAGPYRRVWQEGNLPGFQSMCMTLPELHMAIVVLANEDDRASAHALGLLTEEIAKTLDPRAAPLLVGSADARGQKTHAAGYTPSTFTISATALSCIRAPRASLSSPRTKSA